MSPSRFLEWLRKQAEKIMQSVEQAMVFRLGILAEGDGSAAVHGAHQ